MKLSLKVIPGSSRDEISGWLGDSLKIRVRAPAESGKANAAVTAIPAKKTNMQTVSGHAGNPAALLPVVLLNHPPHIK